MVALSPGRYDAAADTTGSQGAAIPRGPCRTHQTSGRPAAIPPGSDPDGNGNPGVSLRSTPGKWLSSLRDDLAASLSSIRYRVKFVDLCSGQRPGILQHSPTDWVIDPRKIRAPQTGRDTRMTRIPRIDPSFSARTPEAW